MAKKPKAGILHIAAAIALLFLLFSCTAKAPVTESPGIINPEGCCAIAAGAEEKIAGLEYRMDELEGRMTLLQTENEMLKSQIECLKKASSASCE